MSALDALLTVQELDTRLDQLDHRLRTLPEGRARDAARAAVSAAESELADVDARLHAVRSAQKEAEDHASLIEDKVAEIQASLYDGSVTAHKELESLQAEATMLTERQRGFEDDALEHMELAEPLEAEVGRRTEALGAARGDLARAEAEFEAAAGEVRSEMLAVRSERDADAAAIEPAVLERYEALRDGLGGVAVARLVGARCEGCHLEIPSAQLEGLRRAPEDEMVSCPECARLLVR